MPSLLLVAPTFAPSRLIGGRRAERMALHLSQRGWQVTVLTLKPAYMQPVDPGRRAHGDFEVVATQALMPRTWARLVRDRLRQAHRPNQPGRPGAAAPQQRPLRRLAERLARTLEFPDEFIGWLPIARAAVRGRRFDVVLGSGPPATAHVVAHDLAQRTGARLVLDYRDPWTETLVLQGEDSARIDRHRAVEDALLGQADLILGVTPTICRWLAGRTRKPVVLLPNAVDAPATPQLAKGPPYRLVYAGSLAYGRDLSPLVRALRALRPEVGADRLQLVYAGPHGQSVRAQAEAAGVLDAVQDLGELPGHQARALLDGALAGVVVVGPPLLYPYPGKLFEILGQGTPVLLLAPTGCDAAELVTRHHLGWQVAPDDTHGLAAVLRQALAGPPPQPVGLERYSAEQTMAELDARLRPLLEGRPADG